MLELIIITIAIALIFDFWNGVNDAANSISTVIATRVLPPMVAVGWAAWWNFAAAFGFGVGVAKTVGKGIVSTTIIDEPMILNPSSDKNDL